jgi:alpha-L-fucosidase 2
MYFCVIPKLSMKTVPTICALLLALFLSSSEIKADECLPLKVRHPEGNYIVPGVMGDIVYRRVSGFELALDAYVQKRGSDRPAVMVIHGGGWNSGSRTAFIGQFLEILTNAGYNWFSVDYRLGEIKDNTNALSDLRAALAFIRCHAKEFRIDTHRIALLGEDTGAHLAATLAAETPESIRASVLIGGLYDGNEASNFESKLTKVMPDTLIVHGTADRESPPTNALRFCESLKKLKGRCDYLPIEGAIHRPENWLPARWGYKKELISWLGSKLDPAKPDHEPYVTNLKKDIVYNSTHNLKLDAYIPNGRGLFPAVIIAHGGGWEAGDKVTYATPIFEPLARAGFAWFSIDYRLTPQFHHQDQLEDLRQAIYFVRDNAKQFRVDPKRLAILGESASGQMVAQIATEVDKDVAAIVSFYGVYDFVSRAGELSPRSIPTRLFGITKWDDEARETLRRYSPLYNANKYMPPMLLICGTRDGLFAQHEAYVKKLVEIGAPHESFTIKDAPHGMENWEGHPEWMGYKGKLVEWLRTKLVLEKQQ